jgi:hypothetical protein
VSLVIAVPVGVPTMGRSPLAVNSLLRERMSSSVDAVASTRTLVPGRVRACSPGRRRGGIREFWQGCPGAPCVPPAEVVIPAYPPLTPMTPMRLVGSAEALSVVARRSLPLGSFYRAFLHRSRLVGAARSVATRRRATPWLADGQRRSGVSAWRGRSAVCPDICRTGSGVRCWFDALVV